MEHEGSQMSADRCGVAEICQWECKEEKLSLEKKNLSSQALGFYWHTRTMQGSVVCSLLLSFLTSPILLHVWQYVCLVTKCRCCQCETGHTPSMPSRILANHCYGNALLCYIKSLLCQKCPVSDQLVFFYTTLQIFSMIHPLPYLFLGYFLSLHLNC